VRSSRKRDGEQQEDRDANGNETLSLLPPYPFSWGVPLAPRSLQRNSVRRWPGCGGKAQHPCEH